LTDVAAVGLDPAPEPLGSPPPEKREKEAPPVQERESSETVTALGFLVPTDLLPQHIRGLYRILYRRYHQHLWAQKVSSLNDQLAWTKETATATNASSRHA
jgi:hypothetical protein